MARKKTTIRHPLPIRFVQLHNKLLLAAVIGIVVSLVLPDSVHAPACILIGWDVGVAIYLVLTYAMMWRTEVSSIAFSSTWAKFSRTTIAVAPESIS